MFCTVRTSSFSSPADEYRLKAQPQDPTLGIMMHGRRVSQMKMTDEVLQYLQFGAPPLATGHSKEFSSLFLPSLCLLASDSPSLLPSLLAKFCSSQQTHRALIYASLNYTEIYHAVLKSEAQAAERAHAKAKEESDDGRVWRWAEEEEDDVTPDECCLFEEANEVSADTYNSASLSAS